MNLLDFKQSILQGIPSTMPEKYNYKNIDTHAPKRIDCLSKPEKKLAVENALRYFPKKWHQELSEEFLQELNSFGRIYMYRFKPKYKIYARSINDYPHKCKQAAAIMLMIQNNLDDNIAQHPEELITYGGNGAVFQNWAQYLLTMKYLSTMKEDQTLSIYSGHPMGLFPSSKDSPRVVITNGTMIPNYSKPNDLEKFNSLGVTQYGQMTAGSYMYIGPQGIVHGTMITILNAGRKIGFKNLNGKLFVTSGLGGMSGAQAKAAVIAGCIGVVAEIDKQVIEKRYSQGWIDEKFDNLSELSTRLKTAKKNNEFISIAYHGNIVDLWEQLLKDKIKVELGSDQTSLHNPYSGGYYPTGLTFNQSKTLISSEPELFKQKVQETLRKHVSLINQHTEKGMYFFDYGNAFLLEASRANADILDSNQKFKYPSYVQDIMGPLCFDYGFGPFRWICASGTNTDLDKSDKIAAEVIEKYLQEADEEIKPQLQDNLTWIKNAKLNKLVVGSKARILYSDSKGRIEIALAFNKAIRDKIISEPIILGRDHHDVSGTDSPYRETSNIYDGSQFTSDMSVQNFVGDSFRGATWVSLHNGGGVGWGEVINGGFGMVIDGSIECDKKIKNMLFWDVNNGIARRNWARNPNSIYSIKKAMNENSSLQVTIPVLVDKKTLEFI